MDMSAVATLADKLRQTLARAVVGHDEGVDLLLTALLSRGHLLLEGPPGVAKTLLARAFARALKLEFGRIQFTPDLMPGDVIGVNLFDFRTSQFSLSKGPVFTDILLADEINRTPPKTQAALLEAMQERAVTIDGKSHSLGETFMVIATQNPIEQQGTYPLPEAQLDRFLFKHVVDYPDRDQELAIVGATGGERGRDPLAAIDAPVIDAEAVLGVRRLVSAVRVSDPIVGYVVDIIRATRSHPAVEVGASPRAAAAIADGARARAALDGRDYVIPDDVKALCAPALRHRLVLTPGAEMDSTDAGAVVAQIIEQTPAPR